MDLRTVLLVPVVVALGVTSAGCGDDTSSDADGPATTEQATTTTGDETVTVTASGPIALKVGERATIKLAANPTTGYQWEPTAEPDAAVVRIVSDTYLAPDTDRVGAGGTQEIVVEGVAAGTTTLTMGYARPWEQGTAPAETATFAITVT